MSTGKVTDLHEGWRYKTLNGAGVDISGAGTFAVCQVAVPFRHILRRAELWTVDQTNSDTDALTLNYHEDAVDGAGVAVDTAQTWEDSSGKSTKTAFSFSEVERAPGMYTVKVVSDAGDEILNPALALMLSPVPPGPA